MAWRVVVAVGVGYLPLGLAEAEYWPRLLSVPVSVLLGLAVFVFLQRTARASR